MAGGADELAARARTALHRVEFSRPLRIALDDRLISAEGDSLLDYGCGRGGDVRRLRRQGFRAEGWDPVHRPQGLREPADLVNLGYIVNVIEDVGERARTLQRAWQLARRVLVVSARLRADARDLEGIPIRDGLRTSTGTFQKLFEQHELRAWIEATLGTSANAAAPGIFYVFKDPAAEQLWSLRRINNVRRLAPVSRERLSTNEQLVEPLIAFVRQRGRLPRREELAETDAIVAEFGTLRNAFAVVRRVTGNEPWDRIRDMRSQDLLVFLALSRFDRRARPIELPPPIRYDIRALFGSHAAACRQADRLLFELANQERICEAAKAGRAGKLLPAALYVHAAALEELPVILRLLDGVARRLIGEVEQASVVKFHLDRPAVSYLEYPDFDKEPHPALRSGYIVAVDRLTCDYRDYSGHANPPILHRKEALLAPDDPRRPRYEALTRQEERAGLYADTSRIGRRRAWAELLGARGLTHRGHQLRRL